MQGVLKNITVTSLAIIHATVLALAEKQLYAWGYIPCSNGFPTKALVPFQYPISEKARAVADSKFYLGENGLLYTCNFRERQHQLLNFTTLRNIRFMNLSVLPEDTIVAPNFVLFSTDGRMWLFSHTFYDYMKPVFQDCHQDTLIICRVVTPWSMSEISRVTLWYMEDQFKLLVILNSGIVFRWDNYWQNYTAGVDTTLTKENLLVFTNGSMLAYYQTREVAPFSPLFSKTQLITPPIITNMKKIITVSRTSFGVMAVFAKCTLNYTGPTCTQPVCNEIAPYGVCSGHGTCVAPQTCECNTMWEGKFCEVMSASAIAIITVSSIVGGTIAIIIVILVAVFTTIHCGRVVRQKQVETEMKELLHQSLIRADALAEQVDRDWVIPFVDLVFDERISEGSYGVVMRGRHQNAPVYDYFFFNN
jgi:hypothetical protein